MPILTTLIQHSPRSPGQSDQAEKEVKGIHIGDEEIEVSVFGDNMIIHIENPKDSPTKLLETMNKYSKIVGYKDQCTKIHCIPTY